MAQHVFQLVGGDPALDFLNTVHDWTVDDPHDYLPDFSEALRFGEAAGVVSRTESRAVAGKEGAAESRRLKDLRSRLERICRSMVTGKPVNADDLEQLGRDAGDAAQAARLQTVHRKGRIARKLYAEDSGAALLRLRLVEFAVALLTSDRMDRVKSCPSCGWFFVDTTKNVSRRWCSMDMCGSAAKASAYYWRNKRKRRRKGEGGRQT